MGTKGYLTGGALTLVAAVSFQGCSGDSEGGPGSSTPAEHPGAASLTQLLSGQDFNGNSLRICGSRSPAADAKYPCDSVLPADSSSVSVPGPEMGEECPCFDFTSEGTLVDPTSSQPAVVTNLCPSTNLPNGDWTFEYTIYDGPACTGDVLNDGEHNFTCFDSGDLLTRANPNRSVEALEPGANENHVLCLSENASKTWNFYSCAIATTPADVTAGRTRLDCGCEEDAGVCDCGALGADDLEEGCGFEAGTCDILCGDTSFACQPGVERVFVSSSPSEAATNSTALFELNTTTFSTTPISSTDQLGFDAIGLNPLDNFMYGIANRIADAPDGDVYPHLIRFDSVGNILDLGQLTELPPRQDQDGLEWLIGTFLEDGTYLIGAFGVPNQPWAKVDVATRSVTDQGTFTPAGVSAWAAHPTDGLVYGYNTLLNRLTSFDPTTNTATAYANPIPPISDVNLRQCSGAFLQSGELLLYCKKNELGQPSSETDVLFSVNVDTNTATELSDTVPGLLAGDMASCVFAN